MTADNEDIEIRLLLEAVFLKYGYDFRRYSKSTMRRRVLQQLRAADLPTVSSMQHRVLNDTAFFEELLLSLTVNVTSMFRDPAFYRALREQALPELTNRGPIKVWCAGCATGEELYSVAVLLWELGLYDNVRIYSTDIDEVVLDKAAAGVYALERMQEYTRNYQAAGGTRSLVDYVTANDDLVVMRDFLKRNIVFSDHNLATDGAFGEMDLIICRNVLIYFQEELRNRVLELFDGSLAEGGLLCLGSKESIAFSQYADGFIELPGQQRIYRKLGSKGEERVTDVTHLEHAAIT